MSKNIEILKKIVAVFLVIIILLIVAFIFRQINSINRLSLIESYRNKIQNIIKQNHAPLTSTNINLIDTWMTFSYINLIFKLPSNYFKDNLNILDKRYPNISLRGYIKNNKLDRTTFINNVKNTVEKYFANK